MATLFGEYLDKQTAAAIPVLRAYAASDLGIDTILDNVDALGFTIDPDKGEAIVEGYRGIVDQQSYWKSVNYNATLNPYALAVAPSQLKNNVQYTVTVTGINPATGQRASLVIKQSYTDVVSKNQAIADALETARQQMLSTDAEVREKYPIEPDAGTIDEIYTSPGAF